MKTPLFEALHLTMGILVIGVGLDMVGLNPAPLYPFLQQGLGLMVIRNAKYEAN